MVERSSLGREPGLRKKIRDEVLLTLFKHLDPMPAPEQMFFRLPNPVRL